MHTIVVTPMSAILQRLQRLKTEFPKPFKSSSDPEWRFSQRLRKKDTNFFRPLLGECYALNIEYEALCIRLAQNIREQEDIERNVDDIISALLLTELLDLVAEDFNYVFQSNALLDHNKQTLRAWLMTQGIVFLQEPKKTDEQNNSLKKRIREETQTWNIVRLLSQRGRRFMLVFGSYFSNIELVYGGIEWIDFYLNPFVRHITWFFFLPRLMTNLYEGIKHTIPGSWMSERERALSFLDRFSLKLTQYGFEIGNDAGWVTVGLINGFILTGALLPFALYVSIGLQTLDVFLLSIKAYTRLKPLQKVLAHYQDLLDDPELSKADKENISNHICYLQKRIDSERKKLCLAILNSAIILASFLFAVPAFAIHPVVPLIGALIAVVSTLIFYAIDIKMMKDKPSLKMPELKEKTISPSASSLGLFAVKSERPVLSKSRTEDKSFKLC